MKNIKRIAEDIFKAPSTEELVDRYFDTAYDRIEIDDEVEYSTKLQEGPRPKFRTMGIDTGTVRDKKIINNVKNIIIEDDKTHKLETIPIDQLTHFYVTWRHSDMVKQRTSKIAEEIFQAPSKEELIERALQRKAIPRDILSVFFDGMTKAKQTATTNLFPHGAVVFERDKGIEFNLIKGALNRNWKEIAYDEDSKWYKTKLKDRNVILYMFDAFVFRIYVEVKNTSKIAEDIFKAPSKEDLIERVQFLSTSELIAFLEEYGVQQPLLSQITSLFPKGARVTSSLVIPWKFNIIRDKIESQVHKWQFLETVSKRQFLYKQDLETISFYKAKWKNGTNILKIVVDMGESVEVTSYLFETLS